MKTTCKVKSNIDIPEDIVYKAKFFTPDGDYICDVTYLQFLDIRIQCRTKRLYGYYIETVSSKTNLPIKIHIDEKGMCFTLLENGEKYNRISQNDFTDQIMQRVTKLL